MHLLQNQNTGLTYYRYLTCTRMVTCMIVGHFKNFNCRQLKMEVPIYYTRHITGKCNFPYWGLCSDYIVLLVGVDSMIGEHLQSDFDNVPPSINLYLCMYYNGISLTLVFTYIICMMNVNRTHLCLFNFLFRNV